MILKSGASIYKSTFWLSDLRNKNVFLKSGGGFIQDRSIYEDTGIFAKMHMEEGTMDPVDYDTYTNLFEAMVMTPYFPHPNLLIYLDRVFRGYLIAH